MLNNWLSELRDEISIIESTELNKEAHENMYTFTISEHNFKEWGLDSIQKFILDCRDLYISHKPNIPMKFYSWFDEQAGQLRISMVSSSHNKLPFRGKIQNCDLSVLLSNIYFHNKSSFFKKHKLKVWSTEV